MKKLLNTFGGKTLSLKKSSAALIDASMFQQDWYLKTYPDALDSGLAPVEHYILKGESRGYKPNPFFDPVFYTTKHAAAGRSKLPAALHYALEGWKKNRDPSINFSNEIYLAQYPTAATISPLQQYLERGQYEGKLAFHSALKFRDDGDALIRAMMIINESGLFDPTWYQQYTVDCHGMEISPLFHFITKGFWQGAKPNAVFDTRWYRWQHSDEVADDNPLVHFITDGEKLGHDPAADFSTKSYYTQQLQLTPGTDSALKHYLKVGLPAGEPRPKPGKLAEDNSGTLVKSAKLPLSQDLRSMVDFTPKPLAPTTKNYNSKQLDIHWIIPDFAAGGGGHMTIFRMAHFLEYYGHKQTIWLNNPTVHKSEEQAADTILKHFQQFTGDVKFLDERFEDASGDLIIATDCWTVWPALSATNFKRRFYFVQDFEPSFFAMGSNYLAAEQTYKQDIDCICASPWLAKLMQEKYDRWARPFWLAADTMLYHPPKNPPKNKRPRIAFYARYFTERRAVELGMLALELLAKRGVDFIVDFFGTPLEFKEAPFPFKDHGVATPEELAHLFQQADIGVVFSATNYSLVPQEMMACALPIVELQGESTECIFPADTVSLAAPHPASIADAMEALLADPAKQKAQASAAQKWVSSFSWEASAKAVETALLERMAEFGADTPPARSSAVSSTPKASVVIPTLNAGPVLDRVLKAVTTQLAPWSYEILVTDSGSTDDTLATIAKYPEVRLHQIEQSDFNHGGTRNLGAELTSGDYIAFLTHDAMPANSRWLYNIVTSLEKHPEAAGAFGKHLAWPEASPFTKRDMDAHFTKLLNFPLYLTKDTSPNRFKKADPTWMQLLHFHSDNNSCMRRAVWEEIPYRSVKFGEDQVWADDIIRAGYGKLYAPRAVVYHSHDFEPAEHRERNKTEAAFFKHFFGYELIKSEEALQKTLDGLNAGDECWGEENNVPEALILRQKDLNEARLQGQLDGFRADTSDMF
ncbi:MAG: glycosyltransferase [Kordiimonadaceae bacterium]|nr:glycosyltransferase [Kordiimonadaceae bacterium]